MRLALDDHWIVQSDGGGGEPVTLPHDAMLHERRDRHVPAGPASGFFPGGRYTYRRTLEAPQEWYGQHVSLFVEGAYRHSTVRLNGEVVGGRPSGYAEFTVPLDGHLRIGEANELEVEVDNTAQPNTRWYSGSGLYRRVWLEVEGSTRFAPDGVRFRTVALDATARVEVEVEVLDDAGEAVDLTVQLRRGEVVVEGRARAATGTPTVVALEVADPAPWTADTPNLYDLVVRAGRDGSVLTEHTARVGIRTVSADPRRGLLVNGVTTLLRGGCLHHDNGVLGAATFRDAEFRRVAILKEVGFNAIRAGHTPLGRDLLDACDEIGLFVVDELTDVWFKPKGPRDYAHDFTAWWRRDLASMVAKNRNHPSVVLHSIGNENGETALPEGVEVSRQMADLCRELDPTRLVTAGINPFLNALASVGVGLLNMGGDVDPDAAAQPATDEPDEPAAAPKLVSSTLINHLMNALNDRVLTRPRLPRFDSATEGVFATLDVAGYNYGVGQYALHGKRHPERVMLGTETNPKDVVRNWRLVQELPFLIGDFMWTAWDYLGEAGIGSWTYGAERVGLVKPFPWLTADCGAVDLIGTTTAAGLLAKAAWGRLEPSLVSRPPNRVGVKKIGTNWRGTDAIPTWTWPGYEGTTTEVQVYSAAATVEVFLDGRSLGRRPTGRDHGCTATYPVAYRPGELVAVARDRSGAEVGRSVLRTAGDDITLQVVPDRTELTAGGQDLAFVRVRLADRDGVVLPADGVALRATVEGAASLAGFGSADPKPPSGFTSGFSATFHGEALAVVRAGAGAGTATLTVVSDGYGEQHIDLAIVAPGRGRAA